MTARIAQNSQRRLTRLVADAAALDPGDVNDGEAAVALLLARNGLRRVSVAEAVARVESQNGQPGRATVSVAVSGSPELLELAPRPVMVTVLRHGMAWGTMELAHEAEMDTDALEEWGRREVAALSRWAVIVNRSADAFCEKLKSVARELVARRKAALAACPA